MSTFSEEVDFKAPCTDEEFINALDGALEVLKMKDSFTIPELYSKTIQQITSLRTTSISDERKEFKQSLEDRKGW